MDTKTKISSNRQKKQAIVAEVSEKVSKAKGFVFTNYQGLTHHQLEALKRAMKKLDAEYVATKNTLLLRALKDGNVALEENEAFEGATATLFIYNDPIEPIKELSKSIKALERPVIKFGVIEGKRVDSAQVEKLATLPPLNVLRAQLVGNLQSPLAGLHRSLNWNLQKLVFALNAIQQKKQ